MAEEDLVYLGLGFATGCGVGGGLQLHHSYKLGEGFRSDWGTNDLGDLGNIDFQKKTSKVATICPWYVLAWDWKAPVMPKQTAQGPCLALTLTVLNMHIAEYSATHERC